MLRLGPDAAAAHPGVLTECDGAWVHHVCDGETVGVREVSGAELEALRERIGLFQAPFSMAGSGPGDGSGDGAPKGTAHDAAGEAVARGLDRVAEELMSGRLDLEAVEMQLREDALAVSAAVLQARLDALDAELPAPECPKCGRSMKRRRRKASKTFLTRVGEVTLRRTCYQCRRCGESKVPLDAHLGLEGTSMSPGAERMIVEPVEPVAEVPVRRAESLLKELIR